MERYNSLICKIFDWKNIPLRDEKNNIYTVFGCNLFARY